jgi:hypothetical protein
MSKLLHTSKLLHIEVFLALALVSLPSAFPLDLLGFGGYTFPVGRRRESMSLQSLDYSLITVFLFQYMLYSG